MDQILVVEEEEVGVEQIMDLNLKVQFLRLDLNDRFERILKTCQITTTFTNVGGTP